MVAAGVVTLVVAVPGADVVAVPGAAVVVGVCGCTSVICPKQEAGPAETYVYSSYRTMDRHNY